jgi:hypothetical protein
VISPLLSNIYLHVLDMMWQRDGVQYGTLVRYADDFVVMCTTRKACEQADKRVRTILTRLGLELHPDKTRMVKLFDGEEGFDFLGCHLHKRLSGSIWETSRKRLYFLNRWPSQRSMKRIRQRVRELTPRGRCHADIRGIIASLNPVLRGWGNYFRTGNAAKCFNNIDGYPTKSAVHCVVERHFPDDLYERMLEDARQEIEEEKAAIKARVEAGDLTLWFKRAGAPSAKRS